MGNPAKRFGARYGRKLRKLFSSIEILQKKKHACPQCTKLGVHRLAKGIYECGKCGYKFAGKAYIPV